MSTLFFWPEQLGAIKCLLYNWQRKKTGAASMRDKIMNSAVDMMN